MPSLWKFRSLTIHIDPTFGNLSMQKVLKWQKKRAPKSRVAVVIFQSLSWWSSDCSPYDHKIDAADLKAHDQERPC